MNSAIARKNEKDILRQMSERMLAGWALKAQHCPLCNTALVGKAGEIWCVSCDLPVRIEAESSAPRTNYNRGGQFDDHDLDRDEREVTAYFANYDKVLANRRSSRVDADESQEGFGDGAECVRAAPAPARPATTYSYTTAAAEKVYNTPSANNDTFASLEETKKEYDRVRKSGSADKVSSLLGEKMLGGWTLMAQSCPQQACAGTPLVSQTATGAAAHMLCVCCDGRYLKDVGDRLIRVSDSGKSASAEGSRGAVGDYSNDCAVLPLYDLSDAPILKSFQEDKNEPSYKMSQKLLLGWALLDTVCSAGSCSSRGLVPMPLMRSREGDLVCVQCDHVVSLTKTGGEATRAVAPAAASRVRASDEVGKDVTADADDEDFFEEGAFQSYMAQRLRAATAKPVAKPVAMAEGEADLPTVLLAKINETKATLQSSADLDLSLKAAKLLEQLILTYKQAAQM